MKTKTIKGSIVHVRVNAPSYYAFFDIFCSSNSDAKEKAKNAFRKEFKTTETNLHAVIINSPFY